MRPPTALLLALTALLLFTPGAAAHAILDPEHGHADVEHDGDLLRFTYSGAVVAAGTEEQPLVRIPLPPVALPVHLTWDNATKGDLTDETTAEGARFAVYTWSGAPAPGTLLENLTLVAERPYDGSELSIIWGPLAANLTVRIELPEGEVAIGDGFVEQQHGTTTGRRIWHDVNHPDPSLSLTIRPLVDGPDPAFNAPPSAIGGFVVLLILALLAAGAWVATKKLESLAERHKER